MTRSRYLAPVRRGARARRWLSAILTAAALAAGGIVAGPRVLGHAEATTSPNSPVGHVDVLETKPGHVHVKGWTFDPDLPLAPLTIGVSIDGKVWRTVAMLSRPDVANAYPSAGALHGFDSTLSMAEGTHKVCISAVNVGAGADTTLGCKTLTLRDSPIGGLNAVARRANTLHVAGWAFDPDAPTSTLTVQIKIDSITHTVLANGSRPDVGKAYPVAGNNHGFDVAYLVPEGTHRVCVTEKNISYGHDGAFTCRSVLINFTPTAVLNRPSQTGLGVKLTGWASDPDTSAPINVRLTGNGHTTTVLANRSGTTHSGHNFSAILPLTSGSHTLCAVGVNVMYGTADSKPSCQAVNYAYPPFGRFDSLTRATGSTNLTVVGWAADTDTPNPLSVVITLDGVGHTVTANASRPDVARANPQLSSNHGFAVTLAANDGEHKVCVTAKNVGGGTDKSLGCKVINAVHPTAPSAPRSVTASPSYGSATVSWSPPASDGGAPWTQYTVTASAGGPSVSVGASTTHATLNGLKAPANYYFTVTATNVGGTSPAGQSPVVRTLAGPPPQTTPAPVSTSRYIRNIRSGSATELSMMRAEGAADAKANPSGHRYLILLDIGGQDQFDGGVVLSATTRFVTYATLVKDVQAYVDGYHSAQQSTAPVTIAIGTNNDMDVTSTSGKTWADSVVDPVASHAAKYAGMTIAGANDMEPGFRASYSATKSWLAGYLAATSAPFVFNGSADGCSWTTINKGCNNGWTMSGLYYLAAGAAPTRIVNLPQVYNTDMAGQWKYISLTGVTANQPRVTFGGPLTEWTACDQTNSCGSLTGHTAWSTLWSKLQSDIRLKISTLPYSTDLRIDK
jgi:hypothetical protein